MLVASGIIIIHTKAVVVVVAVRNKIPKKSLSNTKNLLKAKVIIIMIIIINCG